MWLADGQSDGNSYLLSTCVAKHSRLVWHVYSRQSAVMVITLRIPVKNKYWGNFYLQLQKTKQNKINHFSFQFLCNEVISETFTAISGPSDSRQQELGWVHTKWENVFPMWEAIYLLFYVSGLTLDKMVSNNYCQIIKDNTQIHLWRDALLKNRCYF